jgi:adenylyltransferase/sulfurtransferase
VNRDELSRYSRNILLSEVGRSGQEKLNRSRVLVVGAGGLGSPLLLYLTAAGVGHIACFESDRLDLTNLQRQILYSTDGVGQSKADLAESRLRALNPEIELNFFRTRLVPATAREMVRGYDLVLDGSDNFPTRFLVNDVCLYHGIPLISGGILRFYGMVMGIDPGRTACYRCIFEHLPEPGSVPSCSAAGVLGAIAGVIGSLMAAEAIKFLLGFQKQRDKKSIMGRMLRLDLLTLEQRLTDLPENNECIYCRANKTGKPVFQIDDPDYYEMGCAAPFSLETLPPASLLHDESFHEKYS